MSGNESPGGDDSLSLSLSASSIGARSVATTSSRETTSIYQLDPKYKNYVSAVDKALKNFEYSTEWHDLISALSKLNKVITTWSGKYSGDLPRLQLVTKRLSQCLYPTLPGGVHLKTLETYELIFKSIPPDRFNNVIGPDLFAFASGLFPLWTYASEQTRPTLLRIYETYLLPLITHPALEGFLISIFSGISDDENTAATTPTLTNDDSLSTIGRVNNLLGNVTTNVGVSNFNRVLWQVLKSNKKIRLAGINYVIRKSAITDDEMLATETLTCCLATNDATNESVLVQRATLDLLLNHFKLKFLDEWKKIRLIKASLQTLLRRDMSLNRRLFSWLLGNNASYFDDYCKSALIKSCIEIFSDNCLSSSEIVRVLISLLDKPEVTILDDILLHIVIYFKRVDSKQCANLFFTNLKPAYVFGQVLAAVETNVEYCSLLEYLIALDLTCFEYENLLPNVFQSLLKTANPDNIVAMKPVLMFILKKIELDRDRYNIFVQFYLKLVGFQEEDNCDFRFDQFVKPKEIDSFWTDFKLCRSSDDNIAEKVSIWDSNKFKNLSVVNQVFEELLDPRILKEIPEITDWLKTLIIIGCHGDVETISLLVKVLKLLDKPVCFEVVEGTYIIELATRFLWEKNQFETLSELVCLNKVKVEKILLSFLKDLDSFRKLIEFLDFVGDFGDVKLLVYKLVENLDCSFDQYPTEFLELREQAEEFFCKMLRENDLRFFDVFVSNFIFDIETVGDHLSRQRKEKEMENSFFINYNSGYGRLGPNDGTGDDRISIEVGSISSLTSECSSRSTDEEELLNATFKANSTPDLSNLHLMNGPIISAEKAHNLSRSMGDLTKLPQDEVANGIPEIVVQDQDNSPEDEDKLDRARGSGSDTAVTAAAVSEGIGTVVNHAVKLTAYPLTLTPRTEMAVEAKAKPRSGFSKKLTHPHLKVSKDMTEDVQNRILYVLSKVEKFLMLKPDLFINYLKTCSTNQSPRINFRDDCVYLELLIGRLLDFMCLMIPSSENLSKDLMMRNINLQFKACNVLKLLLEKVIDCERSDIACSSGTHSSSKNQSSNPVSAASAIISRRFSKLKRRSSTAGSGSNFITDILTRVKVQKTLLFVLRSTTANLKMDDFDETGSSITQVESDPGADLSLELIRLNYGHKYLTLYQGLLLGLCKAVISLEFLINSVHQHYHSSSSRTHRNHPNPKYMSFLPLTNQPLFHEILLSALELKEECPNTSHFNWMDFNLQILPFIINSNCPLTVLTVTQVCKNLQMLGRNPTLPNEVYVVRGLDYLIAITNAVLFRQGEKSDKPEEPNQSQSSSSIYGIITSFLPGGSSTSPKIESIDETDFQSKDLLSKLDIILRTSLTVKSPVLQSDCRIATNKLKNLLNPICNSYLENFLSSLSMLDPSPELTDLCLSIETMRVEKLTVICTRILNRNLIIFYRDYVHHIESIEFGAGLLISLVKECLTKSTGLVTICEIVMDLYGKFKPESWSKQELKDLQDTLFKIFDRLVAEVCNQNSYILIDSSSVESNNSSSSQMGFLPGQGLQGKTSYSFKRMTTFEDNMEDILASLCINMPNLLDLLWTDDKDRDKVMPMLAHLLTNLIGLIKMRHTSTAAYMSVLKLLKNMSYYSYFRKAWKKEVFDMLLLEAQFFQMIKPHYYYLPPGETDSRKPPENQNVVQIWKVIMDNLFTQDKSSFSELLTRVSVPQTTSLNIFTSKDSEFEGRALLLKRLAFVIWSSEQDQFSKFITNIHERLAEALRAPNSPQMVPIVLRSVFLCFRVLILKFSNLSNGWPIIIHEAVQVLLQLEKQLQSSTKIDSDQLACALEVFKLIELLANLPPETLPLFQMYRWAFLPNTSISSSESVLENNNISYGFVPFLSRISALVDEPTCSFNSSSNSLLEKESKRINPTKIRILTRLNEVYDFLNGDCDTISVEELCQELDLDFIEC